MNAGEPIGVVAGSGLDLTSLLTEVSSVSSFVDLPGLSPPGVVGHRGTFTCGRCGDRPLILQQGRLHFHEGCRVAAVAETVDALVALGARYVIFTNAAGGLLPHAQAGDLMAVTRVCLWPCRHWPNAPHSIEPDHVIEGCDLAGEYMWVHGPSYETRAEIHALQSLGAGAVGMSTAPELHRCRALGLPAAVVSCITNVCSQPRILTHDDVLTTARAASEKLARLIRHAL